jgi:AIR synthase-related protein
VSELDALVAELRSARGIAHKRDIAAVVQQLGIAAPGAEVLVGDDCAAIADGDGWLLFAIEGFMNEFVAAEPEFAGWCGVMVNLSDIAAMGGRPLAVVDALWSAGPARAAPLLAGLRAAAACYGVPVAGGHSNARCDREQFAVAVLGRARVLLSSFAARPGELLIAAIDLRGAYRAHFSNWDAASTAPAERLRGDLALLPLIAEAGWARAAKDISQAGVLGTLLMLLECSGIGATVNLSAIPAPPGVDPARWWLHSFPSFGFWLSVPAVHAAAVLDRFGRRGIAAAVVGVCEPHRQLRLRQGGHEALAWDFSREPLIGCGPGAHARTPLQRTAHA